MLQQINHDFIPWVLHLLYPAIETADHALSYLIGQRDIEALVVLLGVVATISALYRWFGKNSDQTKQSGGHTSEFKALRLCVILFLGLVIIQYPKSGHPFSVVIKLQKSRMEAREDGTTRYLLPAPKNGAEQDYSKGWLYQNMFPMNARATSLRERHDRGYDCFAVKGRSIYFHGVEKHAGNELETVYEFRYRKKGAGGLLGGLMLACLVLLLPELRSAASRVRISWRNRDAFLPPAWDFWRPGVIIAVVFCIFYGAHQWRFSSQDLRMQVITSHPDDGCMLQRVREGAAQGTLNPWAVSNCAYGAIAYSHLAFPSWAAQLLGITPSDAFISMSTRWIKTIVSALSLLAVYALGARLFSRGTGVISALLVATDPEFLTFSSMPFYPDVLMAGLNTAGLIYALSLVSKPRMSGFFTACLWCGIATGIKYLAAVSGPFIVVCMLLGRWREQRSSAIYIVRRSVQDSVLGAVLFGLCFLASNPFFDYLKGWIIPNVARAGQVVASDNHAYLGASPATFASWLEELKGPGHLDAPYLWLFLISGIWFATRWTITWKRRGEGEPWLERLLLFGYVLVYLAFIIKSVTVAGNVGARLLFIAKWPLFILAVAPVIALLEFVTRRQAKPWVPRLVWAVLLAIALIPRASSASAWFRQYGKLTPPHDVATWLEKSDMPASAWIMCGPYPYVPPKYRHFDGWASVGLHTSFGTESNPSVFIEDKPWVDSYYIAQRTRKDVVGDSQWEAYNQHRDFYTRLRTSQIFPYVFAGSGQEHIGRKSEDGICTEIGIYVNKYLWTSSLLSPHSGAIIEDAQNIPIDGDKGAKLLLNQPYPGAEPVIKVSGAEGRWPQSLTVALAKPAAVESVLLGWSSPSGLPGEFTLEGQNTDGQWLTLGQRAAGATEETNKAYDYYSVPSMQKIQRFRLSVKSAMSGNVTLTDFAAYPACPQFYNNTTACFDLEVKPSDWSRDNPAFIAISERYSATNYAVANNSEQEVTLRLKARFPLTAKRLILAFKDSASLPERVELAIEKAGSTQEIIVSKASFRLNDAVHPYVDVPIEEAGNVAAVRVKLVRNTGAPPLALRQCYIESAALAPLSISPNRLGP